MHSQAQWVLQESANTRWLSTSVLEVELEGLDLARRLGRFCYLLEEQGRGRSVSNAGGFQSEHIATGSDPALAELMSSLHKPLADFLWRRRKGMPPQGINGLQDLCIAAMPENIWVNVNRPGHYNHLHEHGPPLHSRAASGIYYPLAEEGDTRKYPVPPARVRFYHDGRAIEVTPRAGLLLLFPTNVLHEVDPVWPGGNARASIAFNLFVRWLDTPLLRAAAAGDDVSIERLARAGHDVNEPDGVLNLRAVHMAAEGGHLSALKTLLEQNADLSAMSLEGWSPLGIAAAQGHSKVVQYLINQFPQSCFLSEGKAGTMRAKPDPFGFPQVGFSGLEGALAVAEERGHQSIVELLSAFDNKIKETGKS